MFGDFNIEDEHEDDDEDDRLSALSYSSSSSSSSSVFFHLHLIFQLGSYSQNLLATPVLQRNPDTRYQQPVI
jgi:hypothetical protein